MDIHNSEVGHNHGRAVSSSRLKIILAIVVVIMVAELIGGLISNSLALLGDAGHMLVDGLALGLSLFAITMATRPSTPDKTFGYHRVEIMAALANGTLLVLVSIYIFYEAYQRFIDPPVVHATLMLGVASIGLTANLIGILLLRRISKDNLNVKAAFWHILGDTISSVGVIIGGIIIVFTGWRFADPIIAILIGCIILWGAVRLVKESVDILLEAVPKHVEVGEVLKTLEEVDGVDEVHDVHVWTITSGIHAMSAHLIIQDQSVSRSSEIVERVNRDMGERFHITHTTLQLECERCDSCPPGTVCNIIRPEEISARVEGI